MEGLKQEQNQQPTRPAEASRFGRALKAFFIADAAMLLFLTSGFVIPSAPMRDARTGAMPESYYDYSAKISPLTSPAPGARPLSVEVFKVTARGANPTFVPVPTDVPVADSPAQPAMDAPAIPAAYSESPEAPVAPAGVKVQSAADRRAS